MSDEKTFYEKLVRRWQDNRPVATAVFGLVAILAVVSAYRAFSGLWSDLTDKSEDITAFNDNVPPIYFEGRSMKLVGDDCTLLDSIAAAIMKVSPKHVIIRSHTSRIQIRPNFSITAIRGILVGNELHARLGAAYEGNIVVLSLGGSETYQAEGEYRERVEILFSDDAEVLVGQRVIADALPGNFISYGGQPMSFSEVVLDKSSCLVTI